MGHMSGVMRMLEEWEGRGYSEPEGTVCSSCVIEDALVASIRLEGDQSVCDQCGDAPVAPDATVPLERVVQIIVESLQLEYEDPIEQSHWDSAAGGYTVPTQDTTDLLLEYGLVAVDDLAYKIADSIVSELWCQRDPYAETPAQALTYGWQRFTNYVQHERRFTFLTRDDTLLDAGAIAMDRVPAAVVSAVTDSGNITTFEAGTQWWRARVHHPDDAFTRASDLGTPPDFAARDNRMTPKGIGAFYGASTLAGARAEVAGYADPADAATVGRFTQLTTLRLVDLRDFPDVPSLFDERNRHLRPVRQFMRDFIADVTKVADPDDTVHLDYIPTQVIAEHLRYDLGVDGICWRSTKDRDVIVSVLFLSNTSMVDGDVPSPHGRLSLQSDSLTTLPPPLAGGTTDT